MDNKTLYIFEGFRVDTGQNCLWRDEEIVSLTPKAFETLVFLVKNQGQVLTKDALLDEVWKDTFVGEATLAQNISTLRKALAKYDQTKEFIETIPRRGYRFIADVTRMQTDEEILFVEKRSVTRIIAERELIQDSKKAGLVSNKKLLFAVSLLIGATILTGFFAAAYFLRPTSFYASKFQKFQINTLFSDSNIKSIIVSPDGKYLAVIRSKPAGDSLFLKQVEDGNTIEILPASQQMIVGAAFSRDAKHIFYTVYDKENGADARIGRLFKMPILGGGSQEILSDIDSAAAVSKDGKKLAFIRNQPTEKKSTLIISDIDGTNQKELSERSLRSGFSRVGLDWSPDGRLISAVVFDREDRELPTKILLVNTQSGAQTPLTKQSWIWIGQTAWLKDGSGLAFVAYGAKSPNLTDEIWFASYPEGESHIITNGINGINGIGLTDDSQMIVADKLSRITSTFIAPFENLENATEITRSISEESLLPLGTDWTADERIVYSKTNNGNADIWVMNSDGTKPKQLTAEGSADFAPVASQDGRYIFFLSNRDSRMNIWRMGAGGENQTQLTDAINVSDVAVAEKNDFIYFSAQSPDKPFNILWRADFDGKNQTPLTKHPTFVPKVSPDGKYIVCFFPDDAAKDAPAPPRLRLTLLSGEDGSVQKQFDFLKSNFFPLIEWQPDSQAFLIVETGETPTLWLQPVDGTEKKKLKTWENGQIYQIAVSKDGKRLLFEKGEEVSSIIRILDSGF